jgi:hypothetical protein
VGEQEALGGPRLSANIPPPTSVGRVNYAGQNDYLELASF